MVKDSAEYQLISNHYGARTARRSGVPLINHIDQGLIVLECTGSSVNAQKAFCLHPLLQNDKDLVENAKSVSTAVDPYVMMLAMEYRSVANEYLSQRVKTGHIIRLSPLNEVNEMLIADKVQNRKDFLSYHKGTHPRSSELDEYFQDWMQALGINNDLYQTFCEEINKREKHEG